MLLHETEIAMLMGKTQQWMRPEQVWRCKFVEQHWECTFEKLVKRVRFNSDQLFFSHRIMRSIQMIGPLRLYTSVSVVNKKYPDAWFRPSQRIELKPLSSPDWQLLISIHDRNTCCQQFITLNLTQINQLLEGEIVRLPQILHQQSGFKRMMDKVHFLTDKAIVEFKAKCADYNILKLIPPSLFK